MLYNSDIWDHRPRVQTISDLLDVEQLIARQSREKMRSQLQKITGQYPRYRNVRGDGNCFYRSVAFIFLKRHQHLCSFERVFDKHVNFMLLRNIPNEFDTIYSNQEMWQEFQRCWVRFFRDKKFEGELDKENYLASLLNTYWFLDFLIIGYMRLVNHLYMTKSSQQLKPYIDESTPWDKILQNVLTYGEDSQGLELQTMPKCLGSDIKVIFVRQADSVPINFGGSNIQNPKVLLLTPGHYDILYTLIEDQKLREQSKILDTRNRLSLSSKINIPVIQEKIWSPPVKSRVTQPVIEKPVRITRQPLFSKQDRQSRMSDTRTEQHVRFAEPQARQSEQAKPVKPQSMFNSTRGSTVQTKSQIQAKMPESPSLKTSEIPILRIHNANNGLSVEKPRILQKQPINKRFDNTFVKPLSHNLVQVLFWLVIGTLVLMFINNQGWIHIPITF